MIDLFSHPLYLSIHDLTRRSTRHSSTPAGRPGPFNSRPHKEVDIAACCCMGVYVVFQFTTSQGGRHRNFCDALHTLNLSIHDLTRRSTYYETEPGSDRIIFQFTTSQGGRRKYTDMYLNYCPFNSRPHKEVDARIQIIIYQAEPFNSRPHKEVDIAAVKVAIKRTILSIHDLTRRSTLPE